MTHLPTVRKIRELEKSVAVMRREIIDLQEDYKKERDQRILLEGENAQLKERIFTLTK